MQVVTGRVFEDDRSGRDLHVRLDELEQRSFGRAVRLPVEDRRPHVVETAQGEEVVALVVVERLAVPERLQTGYGSESISKSYGS